LAGIKILIPDSTTKTIEYAYINSNAFNVRSDSSNSYAILGILQKNIQVQVLDDSGQWWKIQYGNIKGYVNSDYLCNLVRKIRIHGSKFARKIRIFAKK
jgi:uncharacterized protein YgiM (DUF1202 family)